MAALTGVRTGSNRDGTCDDIAREIEFSQRVEWQSGNPSRYQFVLDVDGNGWSSRMRRVLLGGR